jgi:hypothetical protein
LVSFIISHKYLLTLLYSLKVPIIPDYLYHLENPIPVDDTYKILAKNCSHNELIRHRNYFVRHPFELRRILQTSCNSTVNWAMNRTEIESKQQKIVLEKVKK